MLNINAEFSDIVCYRIKECEKNSNHLTIALNEINKIYI